MISILSIVITSILLFCSTITDLKERKIYNVLTFPCILIGLVFSAITSISSLMLTLASLLVLFALGLTRKFGMGDLKLLMAVTSLNGLAIASGSFLFGCLVFAIGVALFMGATFMVQITILKESVKERKLPKLSSKRKVCFAPFIAVGYLITKLVIYHFTGSY